MHGKDEKYYSWNILREEDIFKTYAFLSLCLTEHHAIKAYWGSGGMAPHIL
jgi:hypothetical protein